MLNAFREFDLSNWVGHSPSVIPPHPEIPQVADLMCCKSVTKNVYQSLDLQVG